VPTCWRTDPTNRACDALKHLPASAQDVEQQSCGGYQEWVNPQAEDKMACHSDYTEIKHTRNSLKFPQVIKQLPYLNGSEELHTVHNHGLNQPV